MKKVIIKITVFSVVLFVVSKVIFEFLNPVFEAEHLLFPYAIHPFDIIQVYPETWNIMKRLYVASYFISFTITFWYLEKEIEELAERKTHKELTKSIQTVDKLKPKTNKLINLLKKSTVQTEEELKLTIGLDENNSQVQILEKGLYQNILITGTIGTGKTASAMYPFTKQLIEFGINSNQKIGMLILDVKGNYANYVEDICIKNGRQKDLIVLDLSGRVRYNPLDKPELKPMVLANRLKTILTLFSKNNQESYWLDKAEQTLCEAIKLCRLYNNGYVTFEELHKLVFMQDYFDSKIESIKILFRNFCFTEEQAYDLLSSIDYFQKEFFMLDNRTKSIIKSEISIITNVFVNDYSSLKVFCSKKEDINFLSFEDVINQGKIVVLKMNIAEYRNLSKIIATYLKLDFQTTVMNQLSKKEVPKKVAFISDEYHEYVTENDSTFFSECREAKCINIVATQSYTSILNSIQNENSVKVILQNLINKIWFRTDDIFTIEEVQKQIGKIETKRESITISENAKQTNFNVLTNSLVSQDSNISESYNTYMQKDYVYDTNFFTQELQVFESLAFLSDGEKIYKPQKLKMIPYFKNNKKGGYK